LPLSTFFSLASSRAFKDAPRSRFRRGDLNTFISLVENYRYSQCLGCRFLPLSTFFSLASSRAFRDAPHSRFRCRDPKQCLPNFLKMLLLALPQIYTRVFHLRKTIDLHSVWVGDSRVFRDVPHSRFRCGDLNQCLPNYLKMLLLALPQVYTRVFHLWKSIDLDSG